MKTINTLAIVGGGLSGWMTALYLNHLYNQESHTVTVKVIDKADNSAIGVGEASLPSIRFFFAAMGLDENELLRETNATLKSGIEFVNWQPQKAGEQHQFFHAYDHLKLAPGLDIANLWFSANRQQIERFDQGASVASYLMQKGHSPKTKDCHQYEGVVPYGYHFDATLMFRFLKNKAVENGVEFIEAEVKSVNTKQGQITSLITDKIEIIADFYIDCTGASGQLINQLNKDSWQDLSYVFPCNKALVLQTAYNQSELPRSYTQIRAMDAGWSWQIDLVNRRGVGYAFDDRHTDFEQAEQELLAQLDPQTQILKSQQLSINLGYRTLPWQGNCCAIGLSASLLDPMESTGLHLVHTGAKLLASHLSSGEINSHTISAYNRAMAREYQALIHFVRLHYLLSCRTDTPFWLQFQQREQADSNLNELLNLWRFKVCEPSDIADIASTTFNDDDYRFILYGMQHFPARQTPYTGIQAADIFSRLQQKVDSVLAETLTHEQFLQQLHDMPLAEIAQLWASK